MRDIERQKHRQREKQAARSPMWEPDVGLDPRTPIEPLRSPINPKCFACGSLFPAFPHR